MDVRLPDGRVLRNVPDGTSRAEIEQWVKDNAPTTAKPAEPPREKMFAEKLGGVVRDVMAGGVRGAGSIGATLIRPFESGEENDQRRQAMDQALADLVGADTQGLAYGGGKLAGEVAGTAGIGGAAANVLGRIPQVAAAAPGFISALRTGGMTTGAKVAPGFAPAAADVGKRMLAGGLVGGASAGLVDPGDAAGGAAVGAALPPALQIAGSAGRAVGRAMFSGQAKKAATGRIAQAIGDNDLRQAIGDIQTYYPKGAEDIPVSASAILGKPGVSQLEQGSRLNATPAWADFDVKQARSVWDNVRRATSEADELAARKLARREGWDEAWGKAEQGFKPRNFGSLMGQFKGALDQAATSAQSSNPAVMSVLKAIDDDVVRMGERFGPGNLQQIRANLSGRVQPMSQDAFKSAPRDNPAIISLVKEIDDILNQSTGGKWQKVIEGYAKDSTSVGEAAAASRIRGSFQDAETGRLRKAIPLDPDVAQVTPAGLSSAMDAARLPDKSLALSAGANQRLEATLEALRRQQAVQGVKRSATAGGGSDTMSNAMSLGAQAAGGGVGTNMLMQLLQGVRKIGAGKTDNQLAALLMNPDELAAALNAYMRPRAPSAIGQLGYRTAPVLVADQ